VRKKLIPSQKEDRLKKRGKIPNQDPGTKKYFPSPCPSGDAGFAVTCAPGKNLLKSVRYAKLKKSDSKGLFKISNSAIIS
jgi:hypothetical protein